jgi:predicted nucleic acid-binding protein
MTPHYLLDTNVCIEIARGRHTGIQTRMAALFYGKVAICSIVWDELELERIYPPRVMLAPVPRSRSSRYCRNGLSTGLVPNATRNSALICNAKAS